ncbi:MAG: outer membrane lipoprotein-sorting protein [Thermodesulfobacteriota bacterium]
MKRLLLLIMLSVLSPAAAVGGSAETADEIVAAADAVRNPGKPFRLTVSLLEYREGRPRDKMLLTVYSKEDPNSGQYRSLIRFREPPRDENKLMLKNGNILWFYDPASKSSVRMSPQQRLMGQASNGDVVTVNFHKDYRAGKEGEEIITDADRKQRRCHKLRMEALNDAVTYFRIEYWVDTGNYQPVKGKFYSESDRLLKIAYYRGYQEQLGKIRPTEVIIIDGVDNKLVTKMNYSDYRFHDIPEDWFQKEYLPRFKGE